MVITDAATLRTYECDGLTAYRAIPGVVLLPPTPAKFRHCVRACRDAGVPFVARGSGTGLSGGALPVPTGALIVTAKLNRVIDIDPESQRAIVEPGVFNAAITQAVAGRTTSTTRRIRPASRSARSAATSRRIPAERTA